MSGIRSTLEESEQHPNLSVEFMDTKRRNDEAHFQNLFNLFAYKYKNNQFKAIIVTDNDALNFMKKYRDSLFPKTPVVFTGVNFFRDEQLAGVKGFTGVVETFDGAQTIELMLKLHPHTKKIVVIMDGTTTGNAIRSDLDTMLPPFEKRVHFDFLSNKSLDELKREVKALPADTLVLLMPFARDREGTVVSYAQIASMVSDASAVPVYGTWDFYLGHGIVGGRLTDGFSQGTAAAMRVIQVLKGDAPESIPIQRSSPTRFMFDTRQLRRFDISESDLPKDSYLGYQSWYQINRVYVWINVLGAVVLLVLVFLLAASQIKRKQAQKDELAESRRSTLLLEKSRDLLNKLSQNVPGAIFQFQLFPDGHSCFPYASSGINDVYGATPEQVKEDATAAFAVLHPDDLDMVSSTIQESARTLQTWQLEYRVQLPKKGLIWLSGVAKPELLEDGSVIWHGFITDISERRKVEALLGQLTERLSLSTQAGGVGIWDYDVVNNILTWDEQMYALYGIKRDQFSGAYEAWRSGLYPEDAARGDEESQMSLAGKKEYDTEFRVLWPNGAIHNIRARAKVIRDASGRPLRMLGTNWDITEHKESEITLQKAKEAAEELAHSKSEFLANMSHEIRTPMNAIIGLSNLALNKEMSDQVRDYLFKINSSSESLLGILNDILDFSKIEAGKLGIESRSFNLANMLDDLSDLFLAQALGKNLGFTIKMDAVVPKLLVGDSLRIQQILSNLLGNAIKFTPQGKVGIQVQLLEQENSNAKLLFSVSDTGIGISAEDQARLFQPFSQADTSITRRFGGTGLGLAISHRLLQLMGSNIVIDSEPGLGTTFSFELLLGVAAGEVSKKIERRHVERKAGTLSADLRQRGEALSGRHILVAEDSVINQQVVKEFLKLSGVNVDIANNGKEALSRLEQKNYDAILMDIHMPEMGGVEATENIRRQAKYANLPIIALTAGVTQEERANCRDCGMNDFVAKPINPEELISVLCHWIGTQEIPSTLAPEHPAPSVLSMSTQEQTIPAGQAKLSLTGFDFTNLLEMVGGDEGMIKELLLGFREEMDSIQSDIEARIQENKLHEAGKLFHRVKGTAGNLGAMGLSEISATLETSLKRNVLDSRDYDKFKNLFQQTKSVLGMLG